jgi:hypothetical protein
METLVESQNNFEGHVEVPGQKERGFPEGPDGRSEPAKWYKSLYNSP